jgi:hypothetical protein
MKKNVGGYDRIARLVVGPILIILGGSGLGGLITLAAGTLGLVLSGVSLLVGAVLTATGLTQKCPLNSIVGMDTYTAESTPEQPTEEAEVSPK